MSQIETTSPFHFHNKNGDLCKWISTDGIISVVRVEKTGDKFKVPSSKIIGYLKLNPIYKKEMKKWSKGREKLKNKYY